MGKINLAIPVRSAMPNNIIIRDLSNSSNDIDFYYTLIGKINGYLTDINPLLLNSKIRVLPAPWNFITFDFVHSFVSKTKLSAFQNPAV